MTSYTKISTLIICAFALCLSLVSCLGGSDSETIYTNMQNATITSFSVSDNDDVCPNLSSYTFTIDNYGKSDPQLSARVPNSGIIFNADSLPVGSIPDSLTISLEYKALSSIVFTQYNESGNIRNTVNYADTQYVSFDDYATTRLDLVSSDGQYKKSYFVKINIHKVAGDTVRWQYVAKDLWDTAEIADQAVAAIGDGLFWFKEYDSSLVTVCTADINNPKMWSEETDIVSTDSPSLASIYSWNNTFYAAGKDGSVMTSTDGINWNSTESAVRFVSILGVQFATKNYNEHLHAIVKDGDAYRFAKTFDGINWEIGDLCPEGFPVRNFSQPLSDKAKPQAGNVTSRLYIVGGETANGDMTSSTWSCDGFSWAEFQQGFMPAMTRPAIIQYTLDTDAPKSLWILWPGINASGIANNDIYFSENKGVTWKLFKREFSKYADTKKIMPVGHVSGILNPNNYWMYFFGGIDSEGKQQANIFGGQLMTLVFDKIK